MSQAGQKLQFKFSRSRHKTMVFRRRQWHGVQLQQNRDLGGRVKNSKKIRQMTTPAMQKTLQPIWWPQ